MILNNVKNAAVAVLLIGSIAVFGNFSVQGKKEAEVPHMCTIIPDVPASVHFAGNKISLDRYDMYERYDRELTSFCYTHSNTLLILKRANRYFPEIEPILKKYGMPEDFKYLAAIESYLNTRAVSAAKAAGLWQIMPATAKMYGLEVNDDVDERFNVEKSTEAACKYMKSAFGKYKSWTTVAASYNAGMGRISTELEKQMAEESFDLWLVEETSRYVFRMMAIKSIMEDPAKFGFYIRKNQLYQPIRTVDITVDQPIEDLSAFAQENGISYSQLKEFNPWLRSRKLPNKSGKEYKIKIPVKEDMYYSTRKFVTHEKNWVID